MIKLLLLLILSIVVLVAIIVVAVMVIKKKLGSKDNKHECEDNEFDGVVIENHGAAEKKSQNVAKKDKENSKEKASKKRKLEKESKEKTLEQNTEKNTQEVNLTRSLERDDEPEYQELASYEYSFKNLEMIQHIDDGHFGRVYKARAKDICGWKGYSTVAVKILRDRPFTSENARKKDMQNFKKELNLMRTIKPHKHVVRLLGICTEQGPLCIIVEYLSNGNLQTVLRKSRDFKYQSTTMKQFETNLTSRQLLRFAWMISDGMAHLAKYNVLHRDLASRNVLVGKNMVCKISDMGLARGVDEHGIYHRGSKAKLPVKWMAPESLFMGISTTYSDVWSFGIVLWEIVTVGESPYPGYKSKQVLQLIESGYRMDRPEHCSLELYKLMITCWYEDPQRRPTFETIRHTLWKMLEDDDTYIKMDRFKKKDYERFDSDEDIRAVQERPSNRATEC